MAFCIRYNFIDIRTANMEVRLRLAVVDALVASSVANHPPFRHAYTG